MVDTRIHTALFHLHKVQEEAKLTIVVNVRKVLFFGMDGKRKEV